jgi:hypothetical protein
VSTEPYIQCNSYVLQSRDQKPEQHHIAGNTQVSKYGVSDISEVKKAVRNMILITNEIKGLVATKLFKIPFP